MEEKSYTIRHAVGKIRTTLQKYWWLIVVAALVCGLVGAVLSGNLRFETKYQATVRMLSSNSAIEASEEKESVELQELANADVFIRMYSQILTTSDVLDAVRDHLIVHYGEKFKETTNDDLKRMISCGSVDDTVIFYITVTSDDLETAWQVCHAYADVFPERLRSVLSFKTAPVKILDDPQSLQDVQKTTTFSFKKIVALAFVGGLFALACLVYVALYWDLPMTDAQNLYDSCPNIPLLARMLSETDGQLLYENTKALLPKDVRSIGVTGVGADASLVAKSLALSYAEKGVRTLLICPDLADPGFDQTGLPLVKAFENPLLDLICCRVLPVDARDVLSAHRLEEQTEKLRSTYEKIITVLPETTVLPELTLPVGLSETVILDIGPRSIGEKQLKILTQTLSENIGILGFVFEK